MGGFMSASTRRRWLMTAGLAWLLAGAFAAGRTQSFGPSAQDNARRADDGRARQDPLINAAEKAKRGRQIFRFDTFGDEAFWGGTLKLHQAIEGSALGGVGAGVSPKTALAVGLKVDVDALPAPVLNALRSGKVDLDDPAVTLTLLKLNAVVGVTGFFQ